MALTLRLDLQKNQHFKKLIDYVDDNDSEKETRILYCMAFGQRYIAKNIGDHAEIIKILNEIRDSGTIGNFAETTKNGKCGFKIDLDIDLIDKDNLEQMDEVIEKIPRLFIKKLINFINIKEKMNIKIFILKNQNIYSKGNYYRYGHHILIPGVLMVKEARLALSSTIKDEILNLFGPFVGNKIESVDKIYDSLPLTTPNFLYGSIKNLDYENKAGLKFVSKAYKFQIEENGEYMCSEIHESVFKHIQIQDLCLNDFKVKNSLTERYEIETKTEYKIIHNPTSSSQDIVFENDDEISKIMLMLSDVLLKEKNEGRETHKYWYKAVYALKCMSLKEKNSDKYYKYAEFLANKLEKDRQNLERQWNSFNKDNEYNYSIKTFERIIQELDPKKYEKYQKESNRLQFKIIIEEIVLSMRNNTAIVSDEQVLKAILIFTKNKIVHFSKDNINRYYYFSLEEDSYHKYVEFDSNSFNILINEPRKEALKLIGYFRQKSATKEKLNYYDEALTKMKVAFETETRLNSASKMLKYNSNISNNKIGRIIDNSPHLLGVKNGILNVNEHRLLTTTEAENAYITHSTDVDYEEYDPNNKYIIELEKILRSLFPKYEEDSYEFLMCWLSMSIEHCDFEGMLHCVGSGSNGKSTIGDLIKNCFGSYHIKQDAKVLTNVRKGENAEPSLMDFMGRRICYYDEFSKDTMINDGTYKKILGSTLKARKLYQIDQSTVNINCVHIGFSNTKVNFTSYDVGTMRRTFLMNFKMCFYPKIENSQVQFDPNNPYHIERDETIREKIKKDPKYAQAFLSILVKWYYILKYKYGGEITKVPHYHVEDYTNEYFNSKIDIVSFIENEIECTDNENDVLDSVTLFLKYNDFLISRNPKASRYDETSFIALLRQTRIANSIYGHFVDEGNDNVKLIKCKFVDHANKSLNTFGIKYSFKTKTKMMKQNEGNFVSSNKPEKTSDYLARFGVVRSDK